MMNLILLIFTLNTQAGRLYLILKETYLKEILPQKQPPNSYVNGLIFMYLSLKRIGSWQEKAKSSRKSNL